VVLSGGLLPFVVFIVLAIRKSVGRSSWLFVKHRTLLQSRCKARLCGKKYLVSAASREDFFSANPKGLALTAPGLCRNLLSKKPGWILLIALKRRKRFFEN